MSSTFQERILSNPHFNELITKRSAFAWKLSILMLVVYYGFILLIAFAPSILALPLGSGVMTLGIPLGIGIIVLAFALTGVYVKRANSEFDALTQRIKEETRSAQ